MTQIIKINSKNPEISKIKIVSRILRNGGLVAFPTETVYGLGANALNALAVKKIFKAKGRPIDNPLIIHIANKKEIYKLTREVTKDAKKLIDRFWPGPLTLVLKKSKIIPKIITGGLDSVAIRMPANKIALALIKNANVPVAAPSANLSGKPSPTLAKHVIHDLYGKIDIIIDGGKTKIGIESTVIDLTTKTPTILRPGKITLEEIRKILGKGEILSIVKKKNVKNIVTKSPGMKHKHYSPKAKVILIEGKSDKVKEKIKELIDMYEKKGKLIGIMIKNRNHKYSAYKIKIMGNRFQDIAKNLFKIFREFDEEKIDIILVEGIKTKGFGFSIMDRLRRSAYKIIMA